MNAPWDKSAEKKHENRIVFGRDNTAIFYIFGSVRKNIEENVTGKEKTESENSNPKGE